MKKKENVATRYIKNKSGMSLVETLTALAILALMIFCFTPLFLQYFNSINIAGDNLKKVYHRSSIIQSLIGLNNTGVSGNHTSNYVAPVGNIPMELTATNGADSATIGTGTGEIESVKGDLFLSDPDNANGTFATIKPYNVNRFMKCFPETITDDFDIAHVTIYAEGFNFNNSNFKDKTAYKVMCTKADTDPNNPSGKKEVELTYDKDYSIQRVDNTTNLIMLTLYGGTDVCFENSPIVFQYNEDQRLSIEVDAPTMIMVGEKATDGNYYYYVSRGDVDDSGNLKIFRRTMNSVDAKTKESVKLNSAMNDVEWIPAEQGDSHNVITGAKGNTFKYGYYVMCGDNGQVRRFWRNEKTGNYYWGGDFTARTDISFDRIANKEHIKITRPEKHMLDTSYKFFSRRGINGYKLGGFNNKNFIESYNTWSVTALDDHKEEARIYAPVGKMFSYCTSANKGPIGKYEDVVGLMKDPKDQITFPGDSSKTTVSYKWRIQNNHESFNWVIPDSDSYEKTVSADKNPITLTCVDSIYLTKDNPDADTLPGFHGNYKYRSHLSDDNHYFQKGGENITPDPNEKYYPDTSYTLYCGYIPGFMDIWSKSSWTDSNYKQEFPGKTVPYPDNGMNNCLVWKNGNEKNFVSGVQKENTQFNIPTSGSVKWSEDYPNWKANLGVVPYVTDNKDGNLTIGKGKLAYNKDSDNRYITFFPYENLKYAYVGKFSDDKIEPEKLSYWCSKLGSNGGSTSPTLLPGKLYNVLGFRKQNEQFTAEASHHIGGWDSNITQHNPNGYPEGAYMAPARQSYMTMGKPVDITIAYLSEPFAIEAGANPTNQYGDKVLGDIENQYVINMSNDKVDNTLYWHNRRETVTMLDCATTLVPIVDKEDPNNPKYGDISVSIMGGYTVGGLVQYYGQYLPGQDSGHIIGKPFKSNPQNIPFVNTIMNNGIIYLRAGDSYRKQQYAENSYTGEYFARDATGYLLASETNTFHQFYYLNSYIRRSTYPNDKHIGNVLGAEYWADNRHISIVSLDGKEPKEGDYNYLRCHPMSNTKVNAVAWGTAWDGNPEAMWATENGTVLSWYVNLSEAAKSYGGYNNVQGHKVDQDKAANWNDRSVKAEIQSCQWIDNCNNKTFPTGSTEFKDSIGSATWNTQDPTGHEFEIGNVNFEQFYDRGSREIGGGKYKEIGLVNVLNSINDIAYDNDIWIAGGDQSGKDPATYCPSKTVPYGNDKEGTKRDCKAYSDNGKGGSWIYVRYWVDVKGTGFPSEDNAHYLWKAIKISNKEFYNIVQVNNINGTWIATGYQDDNKNGEYDEGEKTVVCWASDPLADCNSGKEGAWTDKTVFYEHTSSGEYKDVSDTVGGINSVATRS